MLSPPTKVARLTLAAASLALARAQNRGELVRVAETQVQELFQATGYTLNWAEASTMSPLFTAGLAPDEPNNECMTELQAGQVVRNNDTTYLPLLVTGELCGWLGLRTTRNVEAQGAVWAQHVAAALGLFAARRSSPGASREAAVLNEVGRLVRGTLMLPELLPKLADIVCSSIDASEFWIALLDETTDELSFAYGRRPPEVPFLNRQWRSDEGLTGVVLRLGHLLNTDDYLAACTEYGIEPILVAGPAPKAWLGVPLVHQERKIGVLVVSTRSEGVHYSEADEAFMLLVADQAAAAVANAQLYAKVEQQAQQLQLINRIGRTISSTLDPRELPMLLAREVGGALDVEDVLVLVQTAAGDLEVRYALADGHLSGLLVPANGSLAGQALREGRSIHADLAPGGDGAFAPLDQAGGIVSQCVLCVPLYGQQLRGVIELRNKRGGHFTSADEELLRSIAEQATVALRNAERYSATDAALAVQVGALEQRNEHLLEIVALGNALQAADSVSGLAQVVAATIIQLTDSPRVIVALVDHERQIVVPQLIRFDGRTSVAVSEHALGLRLVESTLATAEPLGTFTYQIGQHALLPGFINAVALRIADRQGLLRGMIVLDTDHHPELFTKNMVGTLEVVANQAAIAAANVALQAEQQQTVDRLTALNALSLAVNTAQLDIPYMVQMTVSGAIGTTGGMGGGAVVLDEGVQQTSYARGLPREIGEEVLRLVPMIDGDYVELRRDDFPEAAQGVAMRRLLVVPLRGAKLTVGTLWIGFAEPTITQTEREMAVLYGKMAGAVIENLNLFAAVRAARDRMASILASTHEGMLMVDADGHVSVANRAFGELLDVDAGQLIGQTIDAVCADTGPLHLNSATRESICVAVKAALMGNTEQQHGEFEVTVPALLNIAWTALRAQGEGGGNTGALLVIHDVTADRQIEKLRQDMSNMIVHDLRSPLTNLMISVDLLLKQLNGPLTPDQVRILNIAANSSQQMLDLVNALLDIRRLEARTLQLQRQPMLLAQLADGVFERLERAAEDRRVRLVNHLHKLPPVDVDVSMVRRLLQNLVDNALKFSPRNGEVVITGRVVDAAALPTPHAAGDWVIIEVRDKGPGIPEAYHGMIFQLFGQAPSGRGKGTGIGLAFSKLAVEAHGGTIWVDSIPGEGAAFFFTLPAAQNRALLT